MKRGTQLLVAVLGGIFGLLAACGGESNTGLPPELVRYCRLAEDLDRRGDAAFSQLPEDSPVQEQVATLRRFLDENGASFEELQQVAPESIRADLVTVLEAQRRAAETGDLSEISRASESGERVEQYEEEECFEG